MNKTKAIRILAWVPVTVSLLCLAGFAILMAAGCHAPANELNIYLPAFATGIGFAFLGLMILRHRPDNRIGWLAALVGILFPLVPVAGTYAACGLPAGPSVSWFSYVLPWPLNACVLIALPLLFPDGRYLSPGWRRFAGIVFGLLVVLGFLVATLPGPMQNNGMGALYPYDNPFALPLLPLEAAPIVGTMISILLIAAMLGANLSFVERWRRSTGEVRQQLKWFAYFLATTVTTWGVFELYGKFVNQGIYTALSGWLHSLILLVVFIGFPLIVGFVVFKYRLYDIDVIIRKTLVYATLTGLLALLYLGSVLVLQTLVGQATGEESPLGIVLSTLFIAALFTPLRRRVQGFIDRRFYRRKYDAQQVLAQFAQHARDEVELEALTGEVTRVVQETLQPEQIGLWLKSEERVRRGA